MRPLIIVRPEPGASASVAGARALGLNATSVPLFAVRAVPWMAPDPSSFDALLLSSANAVRHGGNQLERLRGLPVVAVGSATAKAARENGLEVQRVGAGGIDAVLADLRPDIRLLHLAGQDRHAPTVERSITTMIVYASVALPPSPILASLDRPVIALHSARAAMRLRECGEQLQLVRRNTALVALSAAVADAAGSGWQSVAVASQPNDAALLALAAELCLEGDG